MLLCINSLLTSTLLDVSDSCYLVQPTKLYFLQHRCWLVWNLELLKPCGTEELATKLSHLISSGTFMLLFPAGLCCQVLSKYEGLMQSFKLLLKEVHKTIPNNMVENIY